MNIGPNDAMRIARKTIWIVPFLLLIGTSAALAQVPKTTSFQALLVDEEGSALPDGTHEVTFSIYDTATEGDALWSETRQVTTYHGVFSVLLGEETPLDLPFDAPYWLGIATGGDAEMAPRLTLAATPYSHAARQLHAEPGADLMLFDADGNLAHRLAGDGDAEHMGDLSLGGDLSFSGVEQDEAASRVLVWSGDDVVRWRSFSDTGGGGGSSGWIEDVPANLVYTGHHIALRIGGSDVFYVDAAAAGGTPRVRATSTNSPAFEGTSTVNSGVKGISTSGDAVSGESDTGAGVAGTSTFIGVYGRGNAGGIGVSGESSQDVGVRGHSDGEAAGVWGSSQQGYGVFGEATSASYAGVAGASEAGWGVTGISAAKDGVFGETEAADRAGVHGIATSGTGVQGVSTSGVGVAGSSTEDTGVEGTSQDGVGVEGTSTDAAGVRGISTNGDGVVGESEQDDGVSGTSEVGFGVYGTTLAESTAGVKGVSVNSRGVIGESTNASGVRGTSEKNYAVEGVTASANHAGVLGEGEGWGVVGRGTTRDGVYGSTEAADGGGVYGVSESGWGVVGISTEKNGVFARSTGAAALRAEAPETAGEFRGDVRILARSGSGMGKLFIDDMEQDDEAPRVLVWSQDDYVRWRTIEGGEGFWSLDDAAGLITTPYGIAITNGPGGPITTRINADGTSVHTGRETFEGGLEVPLANGTTIYLTPSDPFGGGSFNAGFSIRTQDGEFIAHMNPNGDAYFSGNVAKGGGSFVIDHPLDPANKYLYHSFVESPDMMNVYNGNVVLDAHGEGWVELPDYFQALNRDFRYQLTCIGGHAPVYVAEEVIGNRFKIAGGQPGLKVSWQVTGVRQDPYADQQRIEVEVDKPDDERGRYLHPEAYQQPATRRVQNPLSHR